MFEQSTSLVLAFEQELNFLWQDVIFCVLANLMIFLVGMIFFFSLNYQLHMLDAVFDTEEQAKRCFEK